MVHPGFKETFLQAFRVLRTGGDHARCEVKLKNRNGEYSWFAMELEVLSYEEGCPEIVLGRFEDITRLKELENAYIRQARVNQLLLEDSLAHAEVDLTGDRVMRRGLRPPAGTPRKPVPGPLISLLYPDWHISCATVPGLPTD